MLILIVVIEMVSDGCLHRAQFSMLAASDSTLALIANHCLFET